MLAEIKIRAERKAGEMLKGMEKAPGIKMAGNNIMLPPENIPTLKDLGIEPMQSHRWQLESEVPEKKFEKKAV